VSEQHFERTLRVAAPVELVSDFFAHSEAWLRLNPEWEVLSLQRTPEGQQLHVRYERSEQEAEYCRPSSADFLPRAGGTLVLAGLPARSIEIRLHPEPGDITGIEWRESFEPTLGIARRAELNLWVDSSSGYLTFAARKDRKARLARWLLDRIWLRISPTARRVGLLIIGMEALALLLFIAIVIIDRLFG
jgi:hypothetical protein